MQFAAAIAGKIQSMDAATLYVVVQLAEGDMHTVHTYPLGDKTQCQDVVKTPPLSITEYYRERRQVGQILLRTIAQGHCHWPLVARYAPPLQ